MPEPPCFCHPDGSLSNSMKSKVFQYLKGLVQSDSPPNIETVIADGMFLIRSIRRCCVVFHAKNADTIDPGNIVVRANDMNTAVILICNIYHMDTDVWYDSGQNYDNSRDASKSRNWLVMFKMFLYYGIYMLSLEMITHLRFLERGK